MVMPRVVPLSELRANETTRDQLSDEEFDRLTVLPGRGEVPAENKLDSFGVYQGRIVAIDYGGPAWDIWMMSPDKSLLPGQRRGWVETVTR